MDNTPFLYLLLKNGNSPAYVRNKEGLFALHIAAKEGNYVVMYILMTACPDMYELLDNKGRNALHAAAESGRLEAFEFLKARLEFDEWSIKYEVRPEFGSLINKQDEEGNTPMYLAAINGHYKIVDKLKHCTGIHYSIKRYKRGGLHKNRPFFVSKRELQDRELVYPFHHPQFCLFYLFFFFFCGDCRI